MGNRDQIGRGLLALTAGHLFALAGFEISHVWAFSPFAFRLGHTALLVVACALVLALHQQLRRRRFRFSVLYIAQMAVLGVPLNIDPLVLMGAIASVSVLLAAVCAPASGLAWVIGLGLILAVLSVYYQLVTPVLLLLMTAALLELFISSGQSRSWRLEVEWAGLPELLSDSDAEEGDRFAAQLRRDSHGILEACGGVRLGKAKGRDVYGFLTRKGRRLGERRLQEYAASVQEVLLSNESPLVWLKLGH